MKDGRIKGMAAAALMMVSLVLSGCSKEPADQNAVTIASNLSMVQDADGYVYETRNETVYATGDVNIRSAATSQSEIIAVLTAGTPITRRAYNYSWSKVIYENRVCYVSTQYLTTEKPKTENE